MARCFGNVRITKMGKKYAYAQSDQSEQKMLKVLIDENTGDFKVGQKIGNFFADEVITGSTTAYRYVTERQIELESVSSQLEGVENRAKRGFVEDYDKLNRCDDMERKIVIASRYPELADRVAAVRALISKNKAAGTQEAAEAAYRAKTGPSITEVLHDRVLARRKKRDQEARHMAALRHGLHITIEAGLHYDIGQVIRIGSQAAVVDGFSASHRAEIDEMDTPYADGEMIREMYYHVANEEQTAALEAREQAEKAENLKQQEITRIKGQLEDGEKPRKATPFGGSSLKGDGWSVLIAKDWIWYLNYNCGDQAINCGLGCEARRTRNTAGLEKKIRALAE